MTAVPETISRSLAILATHRRLFAREPETSPMTAEKIARVVELFDQVGSRWVLVGAHAVGLYTEPRATVDFDFVIDARKLKPVLAALRGAFGDLGEVDIGAAMRLPNLDIDLIRSTNHPLFRAALERAHRAESGWYVPPAEVLIVMKFLSAISPWRGSAKRVHDVGDMKSVYLAVGADSLDRALMLELAALVYPGAETEFAELLDRIDRGDPISL